MVAGDRKSVVGGGWRCAGRGDDGRIRAAGGGRVDQGHKYRFDRDELFDRNDELDRPHFQDDGGDQNVYGHKRRQRGILDCRRRRQRGRRLWRWRRCRRGVDRLGLLLSGRRLHDHRRRWRQQFHGLRPDRSCRWQRWYMGGASNRDVRRFRRRCRWLEHCPRRFRRRDARPATAGV